MIQNTKKWLWENTDTAQINIPNSDSEVYVSKIDGSYLTHVGMESHLQFLIDRGITDPQNCHGRAECSANIGFNETEQKWYGWSHRAIHGFGIGSETKKGDCSYVGVEWTAKTIEDAKQMASDFAEGVS